MVTQKASQNDVMRALENVSEENFPFDICGCFVYSIEEEVIYSWRIHVQAVCTLGLILR